LLTIRIENEPGTMGEYTPHSGRIVVTTASPRRSTKSTIRKNLRHLGLTLAHGPAYILRLEE
jgi:hypothetical protein